MRPNRIVAIVIGSLLLLPSLAVLVGGGALAVAYAVARDDDGYFNASVDAIESPTAAVTAEDIKLSAEPGSPDWLLDIFETDVRLRVTSATEGPVFVGIGPEADVDAFLAGVEHDEVTDLDGNDAVLSRRAGSPSAGAPTDETFWVASATGRGTQQVDWEATDGRWAVVVMNADGSPAVDADVEVGLRVDGALALALGLTGLGLALTTVAVLLIVFGALGRHRDEEAGAVPIAGVGPSAEAGVSPLHPVSLEAHLDPGLSRWQWLVKWFLAIPHVVVLVFLWVAFIVVTVVAGFSILFTGRYPRRLFEFNVGVLRWTWRVSYYASTGGLGTDAYPPFSLAEEPGYPATLSIEYPAELSRGLVLVKWWLLAIPHYLIVGVLLGGAWAAEGAEGSGGLGLLTILVVVAGVSLLFRSRYPRALFELVIGLNRWIFRVVAYAALMTDQYPPFRLDQGGSEPAPPVPGSGPPAPEATVQAAP
ncbi:MAG: DUF4389 domain-containing protein [Acidimicrobiales bacterium]